MIVVKLMGGLGNQMFQYAAARALAHKHHTKLYVDITGYENMHPDDTPRHYELSCFPINVGFASLEILARVRPAGYKAGLLDRATRQLSKNGPLFTYSEPARDNRGQFQTVRDNTYLIGWWQDEDYFSSIRSLLLKEFLPNKTSKVHGKFKTLISKADNPVALHVRRGDYVTNPNASKHHGLASLNYYRAAMKHILDNSDDPTFFIFSDDIAWCKDNIKAKNIIFVEGTSSGYEDMHLMSLCRHNIIANSSFSWWGAWLNNNPDKIVIAPKVWFQNKDSSQATSIVPDSWIRL